MALWNNNKTLGVLLFILLAGVTTGYIVILKIFLEGTGCEYIELLMVEDVPLKSTTYRWAKSFTGNIGRMHSHKIQAELVARLGTSA